MVDSEITEITRCIRAFLEGNIESCEQLAVLLFLQRGGSGRYTMETLYTVAGSQEATLEAVAHLLDRGLLEAESRGKVWDFRLAPASPALAATLDALARIYTYEPHEILKLVTANAMQRLRKESRRTFHRAFARRCV